MKDPAVFVQQLREVADWYEAHPNTPLTHEETFDVRLYGVRNKKEAAFLLRLFAPCEKEWDESFLRVVKTFPSGAKITALFNRYEVCTRKVVGQRVIPRQVTEERLVDVVEWECGPVLGGGHARACP